MDQVLAMERRRRNLRIVLFVIILATLPFYCAGFLLWATAPQRGSAQPLPSGSVTATFTPLATSGILPSNTPFGLITAIPTSLNPLQPTPGQFIPPAVTRFLSPTPFTFPTLTQAPTLTPFPTFAPPTATPFVAPSATPFVPSATPFVEPTPIPPIDPTPIPFDPPTATPSP
jgi:hypothetical protein